MCFEDYIKLSIAVFAVTVISAFTLSVIKYKAKRIFTVTNVLYIGTFLTGLILSLPVFISLYEELNTEGTRFLYFVKTICMSACNSMKLYIISTNFADFENIVSGKSGSIYNIYLELTACVFVLAPILTFNFILSFFKNISNYRRYLFSFFKNVYIFSELNEKSIELAASIRKNYRGAAIVFTDISEKISESELMERAKEINAICFKKDILSLKFNIHFNRKKLIFFVIDETENLKYAIGVINQYKNTKNTELYVFATGKECEILLSNADSGRYMKIKRINPVCSLTYNLLYDMGHELFENAAKTESDEKEITAVVLGMGDHGTEMVKALVWLCQMDGYFVNIHAFDVSGGAKSKFLLQCPELMDEKYNNKHFEFDTSYNIEIHPKLNVTTAEFTDIFRTLKNVTYIYVSLGSDKVNIETAVMLRSITKNLGLDPIIHAVVYDSDKNEVLDGIPDYNINFVGSLREVYSDKIIINSGLEHLALDRHLKYDKNESNFWKNEYYYRSSMATAIHMKMRASCNMPGAAKAVEDRSDSESDTLMRLEHCRWNAYMRAEGYKFGEKNHVAKTHSLLVPYDILPDSEKIKDDV